MGHSLVIPIELSNLIHFFLKGTEKNFVSAVAVVPRKHEVFTF